MDSILRAKLKRLLQSSDWEVIYTFQAIMEDKWNANPLKGKTEFETVCNVVERDGKINGLKEFFDNIEKIALDHD